MSYSNLLIAKGHCDTNLLDTSHLGGIGGPGIGLSTGGFGTGSGGVDAGGIEGLGMGGLDRTRSRARSFMSW